GEDRRQGSRAGHRRAGEGQRRQGRLSAARRLRALAGCADDKALAEVAKSEVVSVRRVALLAYRQLGKAEIGRFLDDADAELVAEAARAINDVPIATAMPK